MCCFVQCTEKMKQFVVEVEKVCMCVCVYVCVCMCVYVCVHAQSIIINTVSALTCAHELNHNKLED